MLAEKDIDLSILVDSKICHYGSLSFTNEPSRTAVKNAIQIAEENGCILSYDPNLREILWESQEQAKKEIAWGMQYADVLKISDNEIRWFTGIKSYDEAIEALQQQYTNLKLICLSLGKDGSMAYYNGFKAFAPAYAQKNCIDTTGAGDTFCACILNFILEHGLDDLTETDLLQMLSFANAAGSIVTTRTGALSSMPSYEKIKYLMNKNN